MSDQRFDLTYTGLITPGADPVQTRRRLTETFKLTHQGAERLFTGRPVSVQRNVDAATAARFTQVFSQAGAVLIVSQVASSDVPGEDLAAASEPTERTDPIDTSHLTLAPQAGNLEEAPVGGGVELDTSYLSLVPGDQWTLEDCEPPPTPIPEPDVSYLRLEPIRPRAGYDPDQQLY